MKRAIGAFLCAFSLLGAQECTYRIGDIGIEWEAFKTPLKKGVEGSFGTVKLSARPDKSVEKLLEGATVRIKTTSVDSKNRGRDATLVKFFFRTQSVDTIVATIEKVQKEVVDVAVTMNGITRTVPMKLEKEGEKVEAEGVIDLADFNMLPSLKSLNKACHKQHQGKTWQDVELSFELKIVEKCR